MKLTFKKADFTDIEFLWYLRNQPEVFKFFNNPNAIQWKEHIDWIIPIILGKAQKELFVVFLGKNPVGQIRFDWQEHKVAVISISLLKDLWGQGIGAKILKEAIKKGKKLKVKKFIAKINQNNIASQKLFEKFGFKFEKQLDVWKNYEKRV